MKLLYSFFTALVLTVFVQTNVWADAVILPNGEVIKGKIEYVISGLIEINTQDGTKKIARQISTEQARDIVEVGFFRKRKILGEVYFLDSGHVEIKTPSGKQKLKRFWVRDIVMSQ